MINKLLNSPYINVDDLKTLKISRKIYYHSSVLKMILSLLDEESEDYVSFEEISSYFSNNDLEIEKKLINAIYSNIYWEDAINRHSNKLTDKQKLEMIGLTDYLSDRNLIILINKFRSLMIRR